MDRRQLIAAAGIETATLLGGCLTDDSDGGEPEPLDGEWILHGRVVNRDEEPREWRIES